jgi:hypothetical protein
MSGGGYQVDTEATANQGDTSTGDGITIGGLQVPSRGLSTQQLMIVGGLALLGLLVWVRGSK